MSKPTHPVYRGPWQRIRRTILERDNHTCQIAGPKCTGTATHVDHIIPINQGGPWYDPTNLRATCPTCNYARIDRTRKDTWKTAGTHIILVVGPPGAGKSTHVKTHAQPGDLIIDYDEIAGAIGGNLHHNNRDAKAPRQLGGHQPSGDAVHQATMSARNALIKALRLGKTGVKRAWIISANPQAESIFPYHQVVIIDPGKEAVLRQAEDAERPRNWPRLIEDWYRTRNKEFQKSNNSRDW